MKSLDHLDEGRGERGGNKRGTEDQSLKEQEERMWHFGGTKVTEVTMVVRN